MCECLACMCLCTTHVLNACRGQKRILDPLELELWMLVNLCVGTGIQTRVLCKSNK